jgi:hypothetical protein
MDDELGGGEGSMGTRTGQPKKKEKKKKGKEKRIDLEKMAGLFSIVV